ncbi:transposase [Bradyrhizobium yuanmingense]
MIDGPTACECCGSNRLRKLGEDVTRTLEVVPRQWKVIETSGRSSPAATARRSVRRRRRSMPSHGDRPARVLLAMIMFEKFGARLASFGLMLHEDKTRLIEFGWFAVLSSRRHP